MTFRGEIDQEIFKKICDRLSMGESIRKVLKEEGFPPMASFFEYLSDPKNTDQAEQYARARARGIDFHAEDMLDRAENCPPDPGAVAKAKLEIDTIKWISSKLLPKKYGEKIEHTGEVGHFVIRAPAEVKSLDDWTKLHAPTKVLDLQPVIVDDKKND